MKHRDKILLALFERSPIVRKDIVEKTGIDTASVGHYIKELLKNNLAERISHGEYGITITGKVKAESLGKKYSPNPIKIENKGEKLIIDLEEMDTILHLKQKYGRERLLTILDKIKKVIE